MFGTSGGSVSKLSLSKKVFDDGNIQEVANADHFSILELANPLSFVFRDFLSLESSVGNKASEDGILVGGEIFHLGVLNLSCFSKGGNPSKHSFVALGVLFVELIDGLDGADRGSDLDIFVESFHASFNVFLGPGKEAVLERCHVLLRGSHSHDFIQVVEAFDHSELSINKRVFPSADVFAISSELVSNELPLRDGLRGVDSSVSHRFEACDVFGIGSESCKPFEESLSSLGKISVERVERSFVSLGHFPLTFRVQQGNYSVDVLLLEFLCQIFEHGNSGCFLQVERRY